MRLMLVSYEKLFVSVTQLNTPPEFECPEYSYSNRAFFPEDSTRVPFGSTPQSESKLLGVVVLCIRRSLRSLG